MSLFSQCLAFAIGAATLAILFEEFVFPNRMPLGSARMLWVMMVLAVFAVKYMDGGI